MPSVIGIDASRALSAAPTGTEGYSYHLIRALLPRLTDYRVRLYFRSAPGSGPTGGADGTLPFWTAPHVEPRVIPFPRLWTHLRLSWEMRQRPPDLLFVPAHLLPLIHPRRTLVTVHDLGYRYFPAAHPWRQRLYLEWGTRRDARTATHLLADSRATRDALVREYGIPERKITVAYPGYEATLQPVRDPARLAAVRARYKISDPYVLYLGRIQPRKNLERLVNAFARLLPDHPALNLVLAGPPGWLEQPIRAQVQALGLTGRVRFPGYIAPEDKAALLSGALVFAFPSLYEGFGFPVLEAQACGVPVLTSLTSSLPEVAGKGAWLVNPLEESSIAAGLDYLVRDEGMRRYLVARGQENLSRFSWEATAETVAGVIQTLMA